jgi:hypothetical protein
MRAALATVLGGSVLLGLATPALADETAPDVTPPVITSIGIPDGKLAPTVYEFFPVVTDDVGVAKMQAFVDGDSTITKCTVRPVVSRSFCQVFLSKWTNDVDATITVRALDAAGNQAEASARVHVDNVAPVVVITPAPKTAMRSGPVTITLQDVPADTKEITVRESTGLPLATLTAAPWTYAWQAGGAVGSPCFTIWDKAGNTGQRCSEYIVDDAGPTATVTPKGGALIRGARFTTSISAQDPAGIGRAYLDGADGAGRPFSYTSASVAAGRDGVRTITWVVLDKLGNRSTVSRSVVVDNTGPTLAFGAAPKNGAKLTRKVVLTASASDRNGVAQVQLLVNGKVVATDATAGYAFTLDPKKYGKKFTVQLRAYDKAGNVTSGGKRTYQRG